MTTRSAASSRKRKAGDKEEERLTRKQQREAARARAAAWDRRTSGAAEDKKKATPAKKTPPRRASTGARTSRGSASTARSRRSEAAAKPPKSPSDDDEEEESEEDSPLLTPNRKKRKLTHDKPAVRPVLASSPTPKAAPKLSAKEQKARAAAWASKTTASPVPKKKSATGKKAVELEVLEATPFSSPTLKKKAPKQKKNKSPSPPSRVAPSTTKQVTEQVVRVQQETQDYTVEQDDEMPEPKTRGRSFGRVALATALLMGFVGVFFQNPTIVSDVVSSIGDFFASAPSVPSYTKPMTTPPCFAANAEELLNETVQCDNSKGEVPCPSRGICWGQKLRACRASFLQVAETQDACFLTSDADATLARVVKVLEQVNIQERCYVAGCEEAKHLDVGGVDASVVPLSYVLDNVGDLSADDFVDMVSEYSENLELFTLNDDVMIGLLPTYLDDNLLLPWWCYMSSFFIMLAEVCLGSASALILFAATSVYNVTLKYPLPVLVCVLVLWLVRYRSARRRAGLQLLNDVAKVRELAYDLLQQDSTQGHVVLHVRDSVVHDLYPTSKSKRNHLVKIVWPRVVADVQKDNRVLKTSRLVMDSPRDVWQWAATPSKTRVKFGAL